MGSLKPNRTHFDINLDSSHFLQLCPLCDCVIWHWIFGKAESVSIKSPVSQISNEKQKSKRDFMVLVNAG